MIILSKFCLIFFEIILNNLVEINYLKFTMYIFMMSTETMN